MRPDWDEYFFGIMESVSQRATCDRGKAACVIVRNNVPISMGYVGAPSGLDHCDDVGHQMKRMVHLDENNRESEHCVRTIHAEQNAICHAAKLGISLEGSTIYIKMTPCRVCSMMIIACGIKKVVCQFKYQLAEESILMLTKANVEIIHKSEELVKYEEKEIPKIKFLDIGRINQKSVIKYEDNIYASQDIIEEKLATEIVEFGQLLAATPYYINIQYKDSIFSFEIMEKYVNSTDDHEYKKLHIDHFEFFRIDRMDPNMKILNINRGKMWVKINKIHNISHEWIDLNPIYTDRSNHYLFIHDKSNPGQYIRIGEIINRR
jgi:dCMP deaminase